MKRTNDILETIKYLKEQETLNREKRAAEIAEYKAQLEAKELDHFVISADRERQERMRSKVLEGARNAALSTALKAIYITALEQHTLTDDGILLAESMVDTWIKENGGASTILAKHKNDSYLLSRLAQIVEDAAEKEVEDIEKDEDTEEVESDETSKDSALDAAKEFISTADKKELKDFVDQIKKTADDRKDNIKDEAEAEKADKDAEKADKDAEKAHDKLDKSNEKLGKESDNTEDEDTADDSEVEDVDDDSKDAEDTDESKDDEKDTEGADFSDNDEKSDDTVDEIEKEKSEDDETKEEKEDDPLADDLDEDDDGIDHSIDDEDSDDDEDDDDESEDDDDEDDDEDITIDGEEEDESEDKDSNGTVLDELDKEDDVKKAIEIIRNRVADAEKTFIKNNAEDKKKIEELLDKISNNVKKVEDTKDNEDTTETEIAKEAVMVTKRKISEITNNRPLTIMEAMARKFEKSVLTNESVRKMYSDEDNKVDTGLAMESAKIMYGFLETLNTLNLENVDESYIQKVLESM